MNIARLGIGLVAALAIGHAADDRPRLHPLPLDSRNAKSGPAVGSRVPPFDVVDTAGQHQTFESLRGAKGLVLMFFRSADWSDYCKAQLVDLDRHAADFRRRGFGVAAVSYDSVDTLKNFADKNAVTIPLLSDPGSQTIRAFGLLNTNADPTNQAFPGTFILDERAFVNAKYFDDDSTERFSAAAILTHEFAADGVGKTVIDTPQLTLTYSASDTGVTPGTRLTLIVDIEPKPKMHVLAPGVQGYIPADWQMGTSKSWISFPATLPSSHMMHVPSINESVPVYDRHVRFIRDIAVGQESEVARSLTAERNLGVEGAFRFQACDEKECSPPRLFLLRWNIKIGISLQSDHPLQ